ncbi:hypothetical protein [Brenneria goodwinii]|uniref:hypothetical protein n=1 Tax=Brenneria goodwinii TaxID=1109412 RepID=UPI0036F0E8E1
MLNIKRQARHQAAWLALEGFLFTPDAPWSGIFQCRFSLLDILRLGLVFVFVALAKTFFAQDPRAASTPIAAIDR